jgi:hypothetical protein
MKSSIPSGSDRSLISVVARAEDEVQRLFETADAPLDVVSWLSAHLAAVDHAIYPAVRRELPDGRQLVADHREIANRLTRTLRVVERHHSGDVLASGLNADRLFGNLRSLVDEHHLAETELVTRLAGSLSAPAEASLIKAYESALAHAPTRPHPHLNRGGLIFRIDGLRDRILDAMDGRHVPVPRLIRHHIKPGRWGAYLLGGSYDSAATPSLDDHRDAV